MKNMEDKLQKAQRLEDEAQKLRGEAHEERHRIQLQKEEEFRNIEKIDVYTSDDYCGLEVEGYDFYYGYEVTYCDIHKLKCPDSCELSEWAFQAKVDGKVVMTLPKSKLHPVKNEVPFWYLVAG